MKNFLKKIFSEESTENSENNTQSTKDLLSKYGIKPIINGVYSIELTNPRVFGRNIYIREYPSNVLGKPLPDVYLSYSPFELHSGLFIMKLENFQQLKDLYKALEGKELKFEDIS